MYRIVLLSALALALGCEDSTDGPRAFVCSESLGCQSGFVCDTATSQCVPDTRTDAGSQVDAGGPDPDATEPPVDAGPTRDAGGPADSGGVDAGSTPDAAPADGDGDGLADGLDNCPEVANEDQADGDGDGLGDACDARPENADFRLTGGFLLFGGLLVDDTHTLNGGGSSARGQSTDGVFTLKGGLAP